MPATVRELVEAVAGSEEPLSIAQLANLLRLDKSATSRRWKNARGRGYVKNLEERRGSRHGSCSAIHSPTRSRSCPPPSDSRSVAALRAIQERLRANAFATWRPRLPRLAVRRVRKGPRHPRRVEPACRASTRASRKEHYDERATPMPPAWPRARRGPVHRAVPDLRSRAVREQFAAAGYATRLLPAERLRDEYGLEPPPDPWPLPEANEDEVDDQPRPVPLRDASLVRAHVRQGCSRGLGSAK